MISIQRPLDWTNISVNEYIQWQNVTLDSDEDQEDIIYQQIHIFYGKNPLTMPMPEFRKAVEGLRFMTKPIPNMKIKDTYTLNGNKYYLHKKLSDFKVGQYIDYQRIVQEKRDVEMYADFIALFLTPEENQDYGDGYDVDEVVKDIFNYMSIADAYSLANFFLRLSRAYTVHFLRYSLTKTTKAMKSRKKKRELRKKARELIRLALVGDLHR